MKEYVQMNIKIPKEIHIWAKQAAKANDRSLAKFITVLLKELRQKEENQEVDIKNL